MSKNGYNPRLLGGKSEEDVEAKTPTKVLTEKERQERVPSAVREWLSIFDLDVSI